MQNKLSFHQSSVSLEIIGLPDFSNNENKDQISIISQWKLIIIDKPLIEGKFEHLGPIMDAFYIYSNILIKNDIPIYESKLIDIKKSYNQSCLTFKVSLRGHCEKRAYEIFRKEGPLALLPLEKNLYQVIWTSSTLSLIHI